MQQVPYLCCEAGPVDCGCTSATAVSLDCRASELSVSRGRGGWGVLATGGPLHHGYVSQLAPKQRLASK